MQNNKLKTISIIVIIGIILVSFSSTTAQNINDNYVKSTPLKDGTPFYMWNKIKLKELFSAEKVVKANPIDYWANKIQSDIKSFRASIEQMIKNREWHKRVDLAIDGYYDWLWDWTQEPFSNVPRRIRKNVKTEVYFRIGEDKGFRFH